MSEPRSREDIINMDDKDFWDMGWGYVVVGIGKGNAKGEFIQWMMLAHEKGFNRGYARAKKDAEEEGNDAEA